MTVATDIAALKARCTALERRVTAAEAKAKAQDAALAALTARVLALEPVDPAATFDHVAFDPVAFA